MRVRFYIDGFNLYASRLKNARHHRWLDIVALANALKEPAEVIEKVNFYTAYVSGRIDPQAVSKQQAYLNALKENQQVSIFCGNFNISKRWVFLSQPADARPGGYVWNEPAPAFVQALIPQEKGSDVKLGSHLVRDAFLNEYDVAYVITNDTDLVEPIRISKEDCGKRVIIVPPSLPFSPKVPLPATPLKHAASGVAYIPDAILDACQMPATVMKQNGRTISRPIDWV